MKTETPVVNRASIAKLNTSAITGTLPGGAAGTIIYVYLNMRRAGTTVVQNDASRSWYLPIERLSFGGGPAKLQAGNRLYVQARSVGKEVSDPTPVYTIAGLDQPSAPYVLDEIDGMPRSVYERDTRLQGDVPLMLDYTVDPPAQVPFVGDTAARIEAGVSVSVYVEGTFLAQVQSDMYGHWVLDLNEHLSHPLLPLKKGQILSVKATRHREPLPGGLPEQYVYPSSESPRVAVRSQFFERRLFDFYPAHWKQDDAALGTADLANFTKILALTLDDVKSYIDTFPAVFDIDRCDPRYFGAIASLLGYPLNRLDSVESQRLQIRNAIQFWRKKGTTDVFRILFYLLDYHVEMVELWTQDYRTMHPVETVGYPKAEYPLGPPNDAPELLENGGTWYKTPYFGIVINPVTSYVPTPKYPYQTDEEACPLETGSASVSLSLDDLRYLLERIDYFRPAHTVLDYVAFHLPFQECGPIPDEKARWDVRWQPADPGWYLPYCEPDDPIYYRDGLRSTRPDGKGTVTLGITRDPHGPNAPQKDHIKMYRLPERGYCHPGEELEFELQPTDTEYYWFPLSRSGLGEGFYRDGHPIDEFTPLDKNEWPSRNPLCDPPDRSGRYRYVSRLLMTLSVDPGPPLAPACIEATSVGSTGFLLSWGCPLSGAPSNLRITGMGSIDFAWNAPEVPDTEVPPVQYVLQVSATEDFSSGVSDAAVIEPVDGVLPLTFHYEVEGWLPEDYYNLYWRIKAVSPRGSGAWSNVVYSAPLESTIPGSPENLLVTDVTSEGFSLAWSDPSLLFSDAPILGFRISYGTEPGIPHWSVPEGGIEVGTVNVYDISGLESNTTYWISVTTRCALGDSAATTVSHSTDFLPVPAHKRLLPSGNIGVTADVRDNVYTEISELDGMFQLNAPRLAVHGDYGFVADGIVVHFVQLSDASYLGSYTFFAPFGGTRLNSPLVPSTDGTKMFFIRQSKTTGFLWSVDYFEFGDGSWTYVAGSTPTSLYLGSSNRMSRALCPDSAGNLYVITGAAGEDVHYHSVGVLSPPYDSITDNIPVWGTSLAITPDDSRMLVSTADGLAIVTGPFSSGSTIETLTLSVGANFKNVAISADGSVALVSGGVTPDEVAYLVFAPFSAASDFVAVAEPFGKTQNSDYPPPYALPDASGFLGTDFSRSIILGPSYEAGGAVATLAGAGEIAVQYPVTYVGAPESLVFSDITATSFTLSWSHPSAASWAMSKVVTYIVDVAEDAGFTTLVVDGKAVGTDLSLPVSGLTAGTTYYARVRAVSRVRVESAMSGTESTTTLSEL